MRSGTAEEDDVGSEAGASITVAQASSEPIPGRNDGAGPGLKDKR